MSLSTSQHLESLESRYPVLPDKWFSIETIFWAVYSIVVVSINFGKTKKQQEIIDEIHERLIIRCESTIFDAKSYKHWDRKIRKLAGSTIFPPSDG